MDNPKDRLLAHNTLCASLPSSTYELIQTGDTLKSLLSSPGKRTMSEILSRWCQTADTDGPQRVEHLLHNHISYQALRHKNGDIDYARKHELLEIAATFKMNLLDTPVRPLIQLTKPLVDFYGLPPLAAIYQQRHIATRFETQPDYADFRDPCLVHLINSILHPNDLRIVWPFVVIFVYEGSQSNIADLYVRNRTPIDDMSNFGFEPRLGLS